MNVPWAPQKCYYIVMYIIDALIGFVNKVYQVSEVDESVSIQVDLSGANDLQREIPILLSYSDGTASSMTLCKFE